MAPKAEKHNIGVKWFQDGCVNHFSVIVPQVSNQREEEFVWFNPFSLEKIAEFQCKAGAELLQRGQLPF